MTALGAIVGLIVAIVLIVRKGSPFYSLVLGALIGGIAGGLPLTDTVKLMVEGVKDVTPAILRILTAGVLSGILIQSGAAASIAQSIVKAFGEKKAYIAIAFSTMILCAIGVFIDVAVITVAPIALSVGKRLSTSKAKLLLAMIGGGKCGNIISPNPNTIIAAENLKADLSEVMFANIPAALLGLIAVLAIVHIFPNKGEHNTEEGEQHTAALPSFAQSIAGPVVTVILLALRPICQIAIDPLIALPCGGIATLLATNRLNTFRSGIEYGLTKMSSVAILLVGTGTIAGIIKSSSLKEYLLSGLQTLDLNESFIAPLSGVLMSAATASTTAGATIASSSFADVILASGMSAVWGAALINVGATVLDHLPHGSFFHATAGAAFVPMKERLGLIPYETLIGTTLTLLTLATYFIAR